ncbi:MAG: HAMP domain-containing protein [Defluviitaleaceae bacterium]|nr:HAMP domain-containing protein [Defluviitaleaceae bacterium]
MNRISITQRMKNIAMGAMVLAVIVALVTMGWVFLFENRLIGLAIAIVIAVIGWLILHSVANSSATEIITDASKLAQAASAMAVGNFTAQLRTDSPDELGQIEGALAQLILVQRGLAKDIDALVKRSATGDTAILIDEKIYGGEFRDLVRKINSSVTGNAALISSISNAIKTLSSGDMKTHSMALKSEAGIALEELRKKLETMNRDLTTAISEAEIAKKDAVKAREEAADARRDITFAREEASAARREISAANAEAAAARREADNARREAQRTQLRPITSPMSARQTPASAIPKPASRPTSPQPPSRPDPDAPRLVSYDSSPGPKSVKIIAPSAAHEYDKRDYGKY